MNNNYIGVDLDLFRQPKIQRLELKLGKAGVALYLQICLKLAETEGKLYLDDLAILSREFFIQEETIKQVLEFPELFIFKNNFYSCDWVSVRVLASKEKSQKARKAILSRWKNNKSNSKEHTDVLPTNNESNTIKEKESKINENKLKETKVNISTKEEILANPLFPQHQENKFPLLNEKEISLTLDTAIQKHTLENKSFIFTNAINWLVNENTNKAKQTKQSKDPNLLTF